jgi:hypothetical protein
MGDVEPLRPITRLLFCAYVFASMGLMLTLCGACRDCWCPHPHAQ